MAAQAGARLYGCAPGGTDQPRRLAAAAGLSRMHFAAQFRTGTGFRPHEYLLRRRIERAQILLSNNVPTVGVALAVGFQSQAHFTSVFKRFVGQPPQTWRRSLYGVSALFPETTFALAEERQALLLSAAP